MLTQSSTCEEIRQHVEFIGLDLDRALIAEGQSGATDWREVRALVAEPALLPVEAMPA
jgi:hypothetical protein